ncbi:MAG: Rossmann-like and DUF2520 domain-containing protein [Bacteroidia bacterium]
MYPKLNVVIIGCGNVGHQLALAIDGSEHAKIVQVISRDAHKARALGELINCAYTPHLAHINLEAHVYLFCINDSAITDVVAQANLLTLTNRLIVHTSGSVAMNVLYPYSTNVGVLYPLQTMSTTHNVDMSASPIFIEANNEQSLHTLNMLASAISTQVQAINSETRAKYHIAGVMVNNFVNHIMYKTTELCVDNNLDADLLMPLLHETVNKLHTNAPYDAQTGPARRNNTEIIEKHLLFLQNNKALHDIYSTITQSIIKTYNS